MADFGLLFTLILVALTFVVVGMCFIVYIMIIGEREKRKMAESALILAGQVNIECPHFFGYLSGLPSDEPVPDECFGCVNATQCMNHNTQVAATVAPEETKPE